MTLSRILILFAARFAVPLWIGYICSAIWYIYQIASALDVRSTAGPPLLFSRERLGGDLFALAGTLQWLVFGINHRASTPARVASLTLTGLHLLLFAVRAYLVPMLWVMEQTAR